MDNENKNKFEDFIRLHKEIILPYVEEKNKEIANTGQTLYVFSSKNFPLAHQPSDKIFDQIILKSLNSDSSTSGSALGKPYIYIESLVTGKVNVMESGQTQTITISKTELNENKIKELINGF